MGVGRVVRGEPFELGGYLIPPGVEINPSIATIHRRGDCGDAFGSGGQFNTCFHLVGRHLNTLIDCGATSLVSMNKLAINRNAIETILITHFHADHIAGLPFFILEANYVLKRKTSLTIAGPPGLKSRYAALMETTFPRHAGDGLVVSFDASRI